MSSPQVRLRARTPQACERCRRSKTKCTGVVIDRSCRSCLKRNVTCSWAQVVTPSAFYALTPPQEQESPKINEKSQRLHGQQDTPDPRALSNIPIVLPEPPQLERLFEIFFARHHEVELCSFLHKPSLDMPTLHNRSPVLVASVLSLAALYLSTDEVKADFGFETPCALSDHYARLAKSHAYGLSDEPSIQTIQAYLILAIRELMIWSNIKAYMYAGTALRMAQALNLNVEGSQRLSPRQKEVRRRTFWACFVVDRLISYSCNKPFAISFDSAQIQLPCSANAFAFDEISTGPSVKDLALHANQVSQLGIMPFLITMVQLWGDMAFLHVSGGRRRSKFGPHSPESEFYRYEKAIDDFSSSLPPSLSWSPQNYKLHQVTGQAQAFVNLNFLLHHSKCVMHQEYLPQLDSQYSLNSEVNYATSFDAAGISLDYIDTKIIKTSMNSINTITEIALTLNAGPAKDRELLQSIFAANAILTASAVHLWVLYTQTCDACPKHEALAKAENLRQVIKSWQPQWRVATAWVETLEMLYKLYVYSYGKVVESDLDCWDMGTDDINDSLEVVGEVTDESGGGPISSDADGIPDPSAVCQRLYDKIRSVLVNPLLATDIKQRNLRAYCRTLWQHVWIYGPTEGFGDDFSSLDALLGEVGSPLLNMPPLDMNLEYI
ncbi:hypothetical protein L207DRAFT_564199 [Hyaloscypha variabilis F]|uniref:Zn(2)-C6 fungal-type domain-containing protein n=1 Tax=Hyaloscypha variabilis (strain UAMH 11265 / GT02V1 / F) TaxID=1149755 RepID=A0A2J6RYE5_HYAVF|nr:hypothetical protein L207DRAFT_564199 [Hyaloscypha variabilis F]